MKPVIALEPDKYYHVYNHAVTRNNIFEREENYTFFLKKYAHYIAPIADTFAYCLMPNHFHFAVRIKPVKVLQAFSEDLTGFKTLTGTKRTQAIVSKQFSNLFNSYTKSFNKQQNRCGTLFEKPFKRKQIDSDEYFRNMILYIHYNPVHHEFVDDLRNWKHSSFESFFSKGASRLMRNEVIDWFENKQNFLEFHKNKINQQMVLDLEYL